MERARDSVNLNSKQKNPFILMGMLTFVIGTYTLYTFLSSLEIQFVYLVLTTLFFVGYCLLQEKGLIIYKFEVTWLIFILYFLFNAIYHSNISELFFADILVIITLFIVFLLVKVDIKYFIIALNIMLGLSVIYALGSLIQYFNIDFYKKIILPLFNNRYQAQIMELYRQGRGTYTG